MYCNLNNPDLYYPLYNFFSPESILVIFSSKKYFSNKVIGCCFSALSKSAGSSSFRIFLSIVPRTLRIFRSLWFRLLALLVELNSRTAQRKSSSLCSSFNSQSILDRYSSVTSPLQVHGCRKDSRKLRQWNLPFGAAFPVHRSEYQGKRVHLQMHHSLLWYTKVVTFRSDKYRRERTRRTHHDKKVQRGI